LTREELRCEVRVFLCWQDDTCDASLTDQDVRRTVPVDIVRRGSPVRSYTRSCSGSGGTMPAQSQTAIAAPVRGAGAGECWGHDRGEHAVASPRPPDRGVV